jgi:hypothetical protein
VSEFGVWVSVWVGDCFEVVGLSGSGWVADAFVAQTMEQFAGGGSGWVAVGVVGVEWFVVPVAGWVFVHGLSAFAASFAVDVSGE